jgi:hypothetical protein
MESPNQIVGKPYPKAWIIGKSLNEIEHAKARTDKRSSQRRVDVPDTRG